MSAVLAARWTWVPCVVDRPYAAVHAGACRAEVDAHCGTASWRRWSSVSSYCRHRAPAHSRAAESAAGTRRNSSEVS